MKAITVKDLNFNYDKEKITLKNINFEIEKGSYVSIVGHNGSGKSTLAKLLVGLISPNSGYIFINDLEVNKKNQDLVHEHISLVFQNPDNQFIGSTVEDDIAFGLENKCVAQKEMINIVKKYAKAVGMSEFLKKEPSNLSGGQKQRVAIAGALALEHDILILDEATSMLDPSGKSDILKLIHQTKKDNPNLTIISITHDIEEAYFSERVIVLNNGEIVLDGTPKEVFSHEETLIKYNLDLPFVIKFKNALINEHIDIKNHDINSIVEELCQYK